MLRWRMLGVEVVADWSWLVILALVAWSLGGSVFPAEVSGLSGTSYAAMAAAGSLLLFVSVLVHELCHSLVARHEGVRVTEIRLFLFGGASETSDPLPGPRAELRMVAAGPISTAAFAICVLLLAAGARALTLPAQVTGVLDYALQLNLLLLAFNLVPALPLDGGRLLHAWLWHRTGDSARATLSAGRGGQALGVGLVAFGILATSAGSVGGVWLLVIGGFLMLSVEQEMRAARAEMAFGDLTVADVMATSLVTLRPDMTIAELADLLRCVPSHPVYPVQDEGRLVGLLVLQTAGRVPLERRAGTRVRDVMLTGDSTPTLRPDLPVREAARSLAREPGRAAVVEQEHLVGLVSRSDLDRLVPGRAPAGA